VARRPVAKELLAAFARNSDYRRSLNLLGYEHPAETEADERGAGTIQGK
jgi:hypothetical protein